MVDELVSAENEKMKKIIKIG